MSIASLSPRRLVLTGLLAFVTLLAGVLLFEVLDTVFLAVTVAYLLAPVHRRLVGRGVPAWWSSLLVTTGATLAALIPLEIIAYLVYRQRSGLVALLENVPRTIAIDLFGRIYVVDLAPALEGVRAYLREVAVTVAAALPVLALQFALFVIVVFALLIRSHATAQALLGPIPTRFHDIATALHERTRETLFAIYVLQAATAAGTFVLALPVFVLLDYPFAVTLSFVAALLQFLPIVGPSLLVLALATYQFSIGAPVDAALMATVGLVVIGGLPDVIIRPRLARETADLPGSLYFIGFVGGLLTVGAVGIIAGPLVVALLVETLGLLAEATGDQSAGETLRRDADGPNVAEPTGGDREDPGGSGDTAS